MTLVAPFPWFGGKSRAASLVWDALGNVANYVEPFFGSGAVLLARPHAPGTETVNDRSAFLANFWRALRADPDAVAEHADYPVSELDLHARHRWLVAQRANVEQLLPALDRTLELLNQTRQSLAERDSVAELVEAGHAARARYDGFSRPQIVTIAIGEENWREELAAAGRSGAVIRSALPGPGNPR